MVSGRCSHMGYEFQGQGHQALKVDPARLGPMRPFEALNLHRNRIRKIALSHQVSGVRVFGSALRGDDMVGSDLDLLVKPTPKLR